MECVAIATQDRLLPSEIGSLFCYGILLSRRCECQGARACQAASRCEISAKCSISSLKWPAKVSESLWKLERKERALALSVLAAATSLTLAHPAFAEIDRAFPQHAGHFQHDVLAASNVDLTLRSDAEVEWCCSPQGGFLTTINGGSGASIELHNLPMKELDDLHRSNSNAALNEPRYGPSQGHLRGQKMKPPTIHVISSTCSSPSSDTVVASSTPVSLSLSADSYSHQMLLMPGFSRLLTRLLQHLGGGGFAGAVGATIVYPLDTIKTRLQAQTKDGANKGLLDCIRQILADGGVGSLYNGIVPQLLGIAPEKALKLTVNEMIMGYLEQHIPGARIWALEFIAGGGGGFSQVLVTNPMEIVKLRLQIQSDVDSPKGLWETIQELGLTGLYSGSCITLARDVPSSAIFFACYALLLQLYPGQMFWAGFLAAIPATILVTPFDVIKTRLQMETPPGEEPYKDAYHCFRVVLQQEGIKGLFKGGLLRVLRTSPQFGITLLTYSFLFDGS